MSNPYAPPPGDRGPSASTRSGAAAEADAARGAGQPPTGQAPPEQPSTGRAPVPPPVERPTSVPSTPRPPDPETVRLASRRVMHFGLVMLASLVTATLPLPWQAAGLAFAVGAIVLGVRALRTVWMSGLRGTLVPVLGVGLLLAALMSVSLGTMLALWPLQMERQDCLRGALTIAATQACETQFQDGLTQRLDRLGQRQGGQGPEG